MDVIKYHWPEYLMEGAALGIFMISAGLFTMLFELPDSPLHTAIPSDFIRRALIGLAMGLTAVSLIYSPWGKTSGAHMNPAVTLSFLRLGKIPTWDAIYYIGAQFIGGTLGVVLIQIIFQDEFMKPPVYYVATLPGPGGPLVAFLAEALISFGMMSTVLLVSRNPKLGQYTGYFAGTLVFLYITFEAPMSGMSINPARTFASALPGFVWKDIWIYFTAPLVGMLSAVEIYRWFFDHHHHCPKLVHSHVHRCIFCGWTPKTEDA
jgi:aquaporin Z